MYSLLICRYYLAGLVRLHFDLDSFDILLWLHPVRQVVLR